MQRNVCNINKILHLYQPPKKQRKKNRKPDQKQKKNDREKRNVNPIR